SSNDRPVAMRVRDALEQAGYDVFWDQSTPPGKDWDAWIRDQLTGARLVITLWTKSSVASPNVRHEAIIAREAGKLLPVMVDSLKPTDFPMGLFMVQALSIGHSAREFNAARDKFLAEVQARIGEADAARAAPLPAAKRGRSRRRLLIALAAALLLIAVPLWLFWPQLGALLNPDAPPVTQDQLRASIAGERVARARVASQADVTLSGDPAMIGSTWAWGAGQLIAGAPAEARRAGILPADQRARVDGALRRAVVWLNRGPQDGASWTDYPNNDRRTENLVFAAYAAVASHVATGGKPSAAAAAFTRSVRQLPPATEQIPSGAYIPLTTGGRFFDDYRHPTSP